ncbi:hypothetical protein PRIPAC_87256 [Pristionchus pacificus]|uniref:Uncharacterized protein n=1 Tax=Pristionchus pacificus TaxID=54126 RepID=A0A2A6CXC0_PRIPA|nr:hypothetical protein PRIPAC_87256 [Pristionchus pacificus]|eukprot:PDM82825.1 hypothetical protein PRIPAC_37218 [Pristionchus pacificus]
MRRLHSGGYSKISLLLTALSLLIPQSEAFFFNLPGMSRCCQSPPPCCPTSSSSGFGSQLFSSYGVGRMFGPAAAAAAAGRYATAPAAGNAYPVPPAPHPWAAQVHQHMAAHVATAQQHWNAHQSQFAMISSYASLPAVQPVASMPNAGYQETTTPEATTTFDEASFFGDNRVVDEISSHPTPPPSPFAEQIDEETTMYSTDYTREPLRETPSGYLFTSAPSAAPPPDYLRVDAPAPPQAALESWMTTPAAPPVQVESASPRTEIASSGSYFRSKPPKQASKRSQVLPAVATQAVDEFSETATWSPTATTVAWAAASADTRPPQLAFSAFSADAAPATVQQSQPAAAAASAAAPQPRPQQQPSTDLTSEEVKELDDLDMLLITSDASFRPVTSQNPARPLTTIADGLPPNLSDVIFWPIGKAIEQYICAMRNKNDSIWQDITLLKRAIALRRRRDEEARRRMLRSNQDERVSSFLAHYFRRRAPSGDTRRVVSRGEGRPASGRRGRSAKSARDIFRSSILEKILAMEELLAET